VLAVTRHALDGIAAALRALHDDTLGGKLVQADPSSRREGFAIARS
jgi:hypothetical protein